MTQNLNDTAIVLVDWRDSANAFRIMAGCGRATESAPFDLAHVVKLDSYETACATYTALLRDFAMTVWDAGDKRRVKSDLRQLIEVPHRLCLLSGAVNMLNPYGVMPDAKRREMHRALHHDGENRNLDEVHGLIHRGHVQFAVDMLRQLNMDDPRNLVPGHNELDSRDIEARLCAAVVFLCEVMFRGPHLEAVQNLDGLVRIVTEFESSHPAWQILRPDLYENSQPIR